MYGNTIDYYVRHVSGKYWRNLRDSMQWCLPVRSSVEPVRPSCCAPILGGCRSGCDDWEHD